MTSYLIKERHTGLVDGYYSSKVLAKEVLEQLTYIFKDCHFDIESTDKPRQLADCEMLNQHEWFFNGVLKASNE